MVPPYEKIQRTPTPFLTLCVRVFITNSFICFLFNIMNFLFKFLQSFFYVKFGERLQYAS